MFETAAFDPGDSVEGGTDDYDVDYLSEEEETLQLGGEGFTPQQLAEAEKRFQDQLVRVLDLALWFAHQHPRHYSLQMGYLKSVGVPQV